MRLSLLILLNHLLKKLNENFLYIPRIEDKYFYELNVSSSLTVEELLKFEQIREIVDQLSHKLVVAVNGELLDGNFRPKPNKYRLKEGERVELLRPLNSGPKRKEIKEGLNYSSEDFSIIQLSTRPSSLKNIVNLFSAITSLPTVTELK